MMVFGQKKLQDEVFCVTQERDFFKSKYLEQISEIQQMKSDLERSRKEIQRMRQELLDNSVDISDEEEAENTEETVEQMARTNLDDVDDELAPQELRQEPSWPADEEESEVEEEEEEEVDEAADIRQNAAKLLQWANYRTNVSSPKEEAEAVSEPASETVSEDEESVECE
eukprot:CAMPEP_0119013690 /NCGR_PEP_ID=MMETSP1176-20130426/8764_1 /TAXON_ID=265551 /ORGANISM="Synedropsis recta cf, Strain CCMP1620" /LENGTH=169 /DNA_ID=CAMNT_0006966799 /DNA_START=72 /DNA_END=581 /DNA_ORIENTATION=-